MIEDIVGNNGTRFIIAAGAVALGLLCLVAILWFIRNRPSSPFIRGGKNRQPRLAVLDAAAIDTRRRLVLVRRDDVEHLIMIGGPTDVVIESRIAAQAQSTQIASVAPGVSALPAAQATPATQAASAAPAIVPASDQALSRQTGERRAVPQPDTRATPVSAPVSAMGQVLYGESANTASTPPRAAQPVQNRSQPEQTPALRQMPAERPLPLQAQPRPQQPVTQPAAAQPVSVETVKTPEDILDAARNRVLAANQQAPAQRALPQQFPASVALPTPEQPSALPAQTRKETSAIEFERFLDAEITGDLGKLTADDVRVDSPQRVSPGPQAASPSLRAEPRLDPTSQSGKAEPSLEEEMNRMLSEIAVNRKN